MYIIDFVVQVDDEGQMHFNAFGNIVEEEWLRTPRVRSYVDLDDYCVMHDHLHGILIINREAEYPEDLALKDHWQSGCLGAIISRFKEQCTKRIRQSGCLNFSWQRGFYDHIIRNEKDLERIRGYMQQNPEAHSFGKE